MLINQILAYLIVFFINYAGHWFPWRVFGFLVNDRGELKRVLAYIHGTASIMLGFVLVMFVYGDTVARMDAIHALVLSVASAGLGTLIPYGIDALGRMGVLQKDVESYEQAIKER